MVCMIATGLSSGVSNQPTEVASLYLALNNRMHFVMTRESRLVISFQLYHCKNLNFPAAG